MILFCVGACDGMGTEDTGAVEDAGDVEDSGDVEDDVEDSAFFFHLAREAIAAAAFRLLRLRGVLAPGRWWFLRSRRLGGAMKPLTEKNLEYSYI